LATAILERFLADNEPLAGDLLESARTRSHAWLWRQVLLAVLARTVAEIRDHKRTRAEALLVGTAMLALLGFHAVVGASLINRMRLMYDPQAIGAGTGHLQGWHGFGAAAGFVVAIAIGRVIGRFHREHRVAAAFVFSASAVTASFANLILFVPETTLQPAFMPPNAGVQIVEAMLFIAGLFIGISTSPTQIRSNRTAVIALVTAVAVSPAAQAQSSDQRTFDVASIKPNITHKGPGSLAAPQPGGRYVGIGVTLRRLINDAYDPFDILGGPDWVGTERFDVNARAEGEPNPSAIRRMLRPLLADRFKLEVHTELREMSVFEMRLARTDGRLGSGLTQSDTKCAEEARNFFPGAMGFPPPCGDYRLGAGAFVGRGLTMAALAGMLGGRVGRPVIDRTGLAAAFDVDMKWTSDVGLQPMPPDAAGASTLSADGLTLFTALREQLGLRLDPGRAPVEVLVIDRAEPPTPD
jgi:uncharacterized protein (TIGR03435 family)